MCHVIELSDGDRYLGRMVGSPKGKRVRNLSSAAVGGARFRREPPKITPRSGAVAARTVLRTVILTCVSLTRGRSDFGKRAATATKRKESEIF